MFIFFYRIKDNIVLARRFCHANGTWDNIEFRPCGEDNRFQALLRGLGDTKQLWTGGYLLGLALLIVGIAVFIYFK